MEETEEERIQRLCDICHKPVFSFSVRKHMEMHARREAEYAAKVRTAKMRYAAKIRTGKNALLTSGERVASKCKPGQSVCASVRGHLPTNSGNPLRPTLPNPCC